jgi:hypothetical protein
MFSNTKVDNSVNPLTIMMLDQGEKMSLFFR